MHYRCDAGPLECEPAATALSGGGREQVYGNVTDDRGWSQYSFRPGFINFVGDDPVNGSTIVSRVVAGAICRRRCALPGTSAAAACLCAVCAPSVVGALMPPAESSCPEQVWQGCAEELAEACDPGNEAAAAGFKDLIMQAVGRFVDSMRPAADARRGERKLRLEAVDALMPGEWVRLTLSDPPRGAGNAGSLLSHLYRGSYQCGCEPQALHNSEAAFMHELQLIATAAVSLWDMDSHVAVVRLRLPVHYAHSTLVRLRRKPN